MRSAAMGFGVLFISLYMFISMTTLMENAITYQETNTVLNEAIYQTGCFLQDEKNDVRSDEDLKDIFTAFLLPQLSHPEKYNIAFYGCDYENGLLDIGIQSVDRGYEARRTVIIDGKE